jgi:hypothetical protein
MGSGYASQTSHRACLLTLITPSEEPDSAKIGLEKFTEWHNQQDQERLSELNSIFPDARTADLQTMLSALQSRSSVPHNRSSAALQAGDTTQRSGISKYPRTGRGRSTQTASRRGGTGARRDPGEGLNVVRRRSVVSKQGEVTVDNPPESEEDKESTVSGIEQRMQGVSLTAR